MSKQLLERIKELAAVLPAKMYAGSPKQNLKSMNPSGDYTLQDEHVGPIVFGTHDKRYASIYTFRWEDDNSANFGIYNGVYEFKIRRIAEDKMKDPCSIYIIDSKDFQQFDDLEWYSTRPVKVLKEIKFDTVYDCLVAHGIKIIWK